MQKKCKKMQKYLHMSKKSSTFVADLGIVPVTTYKELRDMLKKRATKPDWQRERLLRMVSGKLRVNVYALRGQGGGKIYQVKCSDTTVKERQFREEGAARAYAEKIIKFSKRQLSMEV